MRRDDTNIVNATSLYKLAQEWYISTPGEQIPRNIWDARVSETGTEIDEYGIYLNEHCIEQTPPRLIPALAAISLGITGDDLLAIINHHEMRPSDLTNAFILGSDVDPDHYTEPDTLQRLKLNMFLINREIINAVSLCTEKSKEFSKGISVTLERPNFKLALLLSDQSVFWPKTYLSARKVTHKQGPSWCHPTKLRVFDSCDFDLSSLSKDEIFDVLDRSGVFHEEYKTENEYDDKFFKHLFSSIDERTEGNYSALLSSINSVTDPIDTKLVHRAILKGLQNHDYENEFIDGLSTFIGVEKYLDNNKYRGILSSANFAISIARDDRIKESIKDTPADQAQLIRSILSSPELNIQRIFKEISSAGIIDNFNSCIRNLKWIVQTHGKIQETSMIDGNLMLDIILSKMESYLKERHYDYIGRETDEHKEFVEEDVSVFVSWLNESMKIDYSRLEKFSQKTKIMLVGAGLDIRRIPGITRQSRGHVLTNELGM